VPNKYQLRLPSVAGVFIASILCALTFANDSGNPAMCGAARGCCGYAARVVRKDPTMLKCILYTPLNIELGNVGKHRPWLVASLAMNSSKVLCSIWTSLRFLKSTLGSQ